MKHFHKLASRQVVYHYINTKPTAASDNEPFSPGTKLKGVCGLSHPQPRKFLPFRRAKMVAKCTSAGQFTGKKIVRELLLLKKTSQTKSRKATSNIPQKKYCSCVPASCIHNNLLLFLRVHEVHAHTHTHTHTHTLCYS